MKKLFIIKAGTSFPDIVRQYGDFENWVRTGMRLDDGVEVHVIDARHGAPLPDAAGCAAVVVTGSHDMVTQRLPWSVRIEAWVPSILAAQVPFLGICYGHQLLAQAMGGVVDYHPGGMEAGTVMVDVLPERANDPLFSSMPSRFAAHVVHAQTVRQLPDGAIRLAANAFEPNHAFRLGMCAWGVQFHPEYNTDIMRSYLLACASELMQDGHDVRDLLPAVNRTPAAATILEKFGRMAGQGCQQDFGA